MRALASLLLLTVLAVGCDHQSDTTPVSADLEKPPIGGTCTVQFRRDALGSGASPIPPTTDVMNGAEVSVTGKLVRINADWLVIDVVKENSEIWVPRQSILLLEFGKNLSSQK